MSELTGRKLLKILTTDKKKVIMKTNQKGNLIVWSLYMGTALRRTEKWKSLQPRPRVSIASKSCWPQTPQDRSTPFKGMAWVKIHIKLWLYSPSLHLKEKPKLYLLIKSSLTDWAHLIPHQCAVHAKAYITYRSLYAYSHQWSKRSHEKIWSQDAEYDTMTLRHIHSINLLGSASDCSQSHFIKSPSTATSKLLVLVGPAPQTVPWTFWFKPHTFSELRDWTTKVIASFLKAGRDSNSLGTHR